MQVMNQASTTYDQLIALFRDFRKFQEPPVSDWVHDYSPDTMREQERRLPEFRARLAAIDTTGWTISQKADLEVLRAEMNGLEFDHRVMRPWERDPSFHIVAELGESDVPTREASCKHGTLELFRCKFPLEGAQMEEFRNKIAAIPGVLAHAKQVLVPGAKDLYYLGIRHKRNESRALHHVAERLADMHPELVPLVVKAGAAIDDFVVWLEERYATMPDSRDGIGVEEFDWSMKHVHLVPYTWAEQYELIRRELERSWTNLKMEEHRNRNLPPLLPPQTLEEQQERTRRVFPEYMCFLRDQDVFTVPDYMTLHPHLPHRLVPPEGRDFFLEVDYRNMLPLRCHMIHWLEKQREERNTHPLRSVPLLYNIWDSRAEGFATAFEETMLQAGMMDDAPRARELVYVLLAFRAARAIGDLRMQSREWNLREAIDFTAANTPKGWLRPNGDTAIEDLGLYLRQPGYGTSYVVGKAQFERLIADLAIQQRDDFTLKGFLDSYFALGMMPASLIRWEMTGLDDEMRKLGLA